MPLAPISASLASFRHLCAPRYGLWSVRMAETIRTRLKRAGMPPDAVASFCHLHPSPLPLMDGFRTVFRRSGRILRMPSRDPCTDGLQVCWGKPAISMVIAGIRPQFPALLPVGEEQPEPAHAQHAPHHQVSQYVRY